MKTGAGARSVVIIDDHDIVRFGLETLVDSCADLQLVGSAATLAAGLRCIANRQPDLVISDISLTDSRGLATVRAVVQAQRPRATLIVSMHDEMLYGERSLALGANGYVMKEVAHELVVPAALVVLRGETWMSARLAAKLRSR